jgi:UDP-GlcNAc:undecaprenyl-phosphate GlcNAc-1-phosphate transferase
MGPIFLNSLLFFCAFMVTAVSIPLLIKKAYQIGFMDNPDGIVKMHKKPIPYFGGLAVWHGFIIALLFLRPIHSCSKLLYLICAATLLLILGLVDDKYPLKPHVKFIGQCIVALFMVSVGFVAHIPLLPTILHPIVSAFWLLLCINAFNLIDVMDGLTASVAIVIACGVICLACVYRSYELVSILSTFIGSLVAFFMYNKQPAKIYLGDAGAMFCGGLLGGIVLLVPWYGSFDYMVPVVVFAVPLLEVLCLVVIRTFLGIPFYSGSPHHFALYLQRKQWPVKKIIITVVMFTSAFTLLALLFSVGLISPLRFISLVALLINFWLIVVFLRQNTCETK